VAGALQRFTILRLAPRELLAHYGADDLFYFTEIARHVTFGHALSFDGIHATSGVQPLWLLLLLPLRSFFEGRPDMALRIDLALISLITVLSGLLMPRVVRAVLKACPSSASLTKDQIHTVGIVAGCIWLVHPRVLNITFEGTEGALAVLCWQLSILAWATEGRPWGSLRLGIALGSGTLARIDHLALALAFLARPCARGRSMRRSAAIALPIAGLWGSWLLFCAVTTGSIVPDSGAAKRMAFERIEMLGRPDGAGTLAILSGKLHAAATGLLAVVRILLHAGRHTSRFSLVAASIVLLTLAAAAWQKVRPSDGIDPSRKGWREAIRQVAPLTTAVGRAFAPIIAAAGGTLVAHVLLLQHVRVWYALPALLSMTIVASALLVDAARSAIPALDLATQPWVLALSCALWLACAWTEEIVSRSNLPSWCASYEITAEKVVEVTPEAARIGAFNAGILGAFGSRGGRRVVDLDGVVNHSALHALESRTLTEYLDKEEITFIADYASTIPVMEAIGAPGLQARLERVASVNFEDRPGAVIVIWRVRPPR
jgi:hypothetical protein